MDEITKAKPASSKGRYIISVSVATTMGPGISVDSSKATERDIFPETGSEASGSDADGAEPAGSDAAEDTESVPA
jgi:hypothetical protein